ncbi:endonuclease/exonuclease/phosphatase family protein [Aestuariibacter sp. A3R04]|uniref:endonuclease/exonuclease/phosphatase family protein n=1 Tax=Aestuariibacter sp. A3R04 TaxID=2841571 RepID=UPI001C09BE44|nr:endonuclease/exonuclease/phosphatase family protein [Aestuariibacter sp. A3R04]
MIRFFLIICILFSTSAFAQELKIATWNIQWLSDHENNVRTEKDYQELRDYTQQLNADVIALQEIESVALTQKALGDDYDVYVSSKDWFQRVGVAVRKSAGYDIKALEYKALDVGSVRYGMDVTLGKEGKQFRLLSVHLKSGCFEKPLDKDNVDAMPTTEEKQQKEKNACYLLGKQIEPLEAWIDARAKEGTPFAVLGDFNRRFVQDIANKQSEASGLWQAIDDEGAEAMWSPTLTKDSECWGGYYKDYIDHIVLDPNARSLLIDDSFEQLIFAGSYSEDAHRLSDHCPIAVTLSL